MSPIRQMGRAGRGADVVAPCLSHFQKNLNHLKQSGIRDIRWKGVSIPYSVFDKDQRVTHAAITENKRLSAVLETTHGVRTHRSAQHRGMELKTGPKSKEETGRSLEDSCRITTPAWLFRAAIYEVSAQPSHARTPPSGTFPIAHIFRPRLVRRTLQEIRGLCSHVAEQSIYASRDISTLQGNGHFYLCLGDARGRDPVRGGGSVV